MKFISFHLLLMTQALTLALVWDKGYSAFSLESLVGALAALVVGLALGLVSTGMARFRAMLLVFLFLLLVDAFFLHATWVTWMVLAVGLSLAAVFYDKLPATALVASGFAFALILLMQAPRAHAKEVVLPGAEGADSSAFVVHLLFDELGGLDAIPAAYRRQQDIVEITEGYAARGFTIYENILSISPDTYRSMSVLLDNAFLENQAGNVEKVDGEDRYRVISNAVQQNMERAGWPVTIVQSWYLDYCRPEFSCFTYSIDGSAGVFEQLPSRRLRLQVLWREFVAALVSKRRGTVLMDLAKPAVHDHLTLRRNWRNPTLPFVAMQQLEKLQEGLVQGSGRHYVFAHILLPHFPWVLDGHCKSKDLSDWRLPYSARKMASSSPTRKEAYIAYQDQSLCLHRKVLALIDAMDAAHPGQVNFVIQGDHGPRIMRRKIPAKGVDSLDVQTQKNLLSAFVAARLGVDVPEPVVSAGSSLQTLVPELLLRAAQGPKKEDEVPDSRPGEGGIKARSHTPSAGAPSGATAVP